MAAVNSDIVAEREEHLDDGLNEGLAVASRQVGPSHGTREEGVADEDLAIRCEVDGTTSWGMPGEVEHGGLVFTHLEPLAVDVLVRDLRGARGREAEPLGLDREVRKEEPVAEMDCTGAPVRSAASAAPAA